MWKLEGSSLLLFFLKGLREGQGRIRLGQNYYWGSLDMDYSLDGNNQNNNNNNIGSRWFIIPAPLGLEKGPEAVMNVYVCLDLSLFHIKALSCWEPLRD